MNSFGSSITYIPQEYLPDGDESNRNSIKAINYYNLDQNNGWTIHRISIPWATTRKPKITSAELELVADMKTIYGDKFTNPSAGDKISFINPLNGTEHTLEIREIIKKENNFSVPGYDFPDKNIVMSFTVLPDIDKKYFSVRDTEQNDVPVKTGEKITDSEASSIAIIGGADGPTAFFVSDRQTTQSDIHSAVSALKWEHEKEIEWQMIFRQKPDEDKKLQLI
jgi:hypothetical protein